MLSLGAVATHAESFPSVTVGTSWGNRTWSVAKKAFAWERPFTKADIKRFGDAALPAGPIVAVRAEDLHDKEAILSEGLPGFFTIAHFDGYPAVLIDLSVGRARDVRDAIRDGWLACAPDDIAADYLRTRRRR